MEKRMKKLLIILVFLSIHYDVFITTCPDAQQYHDVVNSRLKNAIIVYLQDHDLQTEGLGDIPSSAGGVIGKPNLAS
jgi:hypothetical protein